MTIKTRLRMTASELVVGRYMRAPDHDASTGDGGGGGDQGTPSGEGKGAGEEQLTTEQRLEREFDNGEDLAEGDEGDEGSDDGSEQGDATDEDDEESDEDGGTDEAGDGDEGEDGDESGDEGSEGDDGQPSAEESQKIKDLTERAEKAEREASEAKAAAEKAGVVFGAADEDVTIPEEPDASKYEFGDKDLEYIKDHAKWEAKMETLQEQAKARFTSEAASLEAKWTKNLVEAVKNYPDFDEVVVAGAKDEEKGWPCPPVIALGIKDSDVGYHIAYDLAKNPDEATRISKLSPLEQAREFGRLEERHFAKVERAKKKAERDADRDRNGQPRRVTRAPNPPKRRVSGNSGRSAVPYDTDDFDAFEKRVDAELKAKRG